VLTKLHRKNVLCQGTFGRHEAHIDFAEETSCKEKRTKRWIATHIPGNTVASMYLFCLGPESEMFIPKIKMLMYELVSLYKEHTRSCKYFKYILSILYLHF
jgi:hypothetical protein